MEGILHRPRGVSCVQERADVIGAGFFHQVPELPGLEVARVVLDGDLDAMTTVLVAHRLAGRDGVLDVPLQGDLALPILRPAEIAANERGSQDPCDPEHLQQLLAGGAVFLDEARGGRADRTKADLDLDAVAVGMLPDSLEMIRVRTPEKPRLGEVRYCGAVLAGEIEKVERGPALRPQAEQIETESFGWHLGFHEARRGGAGKQEFATCHQRCSLNGRKGHAELQPALAIRIERSPFRLAPVAAGAVSGRAVVTARLRPRPRLEIPAAGLRSRLATGQAPGRLPPVPREFAGAFPESGFGRRSGRSRAPA